MMDGRGMVGSTLLTKKKNADTLYMGIMFFLMCFDALPFLPGTYRPVLSFISIAFVLVTIFFLAVVRFGGLKAYAWAFVGFYMYSVPVSFVKSIGIGNYSGSIDYFLSLSMGLASFFLIYLIMEKATESGEDYIEGMKRNATGVLVFLLAIGLIEMLALFFAPLAPMRDRIISLFTDRVQKTIQWTSREQAWGAINVLFLLPFVKSRDNFMGKKFVLALAYVEIILSLSMTAWITAVIVESAYFFFVGKNKIKTIALTAAGLLIIVYGFSYYFSHSAENENSWRQIERFRKIFLTLDYTDFLRFSSSETIRIGFPAAGVAQLGVDPLSGVGGGNSRFHMAGYFYDLMPWGRDMPEVRFYLDEPSSSGTPRSLFPRILGETGLVGFSLFCTGLLISFGTLFRKEAKKDKNWKMYANLAITTISITLQLDTFLLIPFWMGLAILGGWRPDVEYFGDGCRHGRSYREEKA